MSSRAGRSVQEGRVTVLGRACSPAPAQHSALHTDLHITRSCSWRQLTRAQGQTLPSSVDLGHDKGSGKLGVVAKHVTVSCPSSLFMFPYKKSIASFGQYGIFKGRVIKLKIFFFLEV